MHVHASALQALIVFAFVAIIGVGWRIVAMRNADSPWGKAMGVIY